MNIENLPPGWKTLGSLVTGYLAEEYKKMAEQSGPVLVDDDCPLTPSVIVVDEDNVWRISDPLVISKVLRAVGFLSLFQVLAIYAHPFFLPANIPSLN